MLRCYDFTGQGHSALQDFRRLARESSALRSAGAGIQTLSEEVSARNAPITVMSSTGTAPQNDRAIP
jgi:hypothetical protein